MFPFNPVCLVAPELGDTPIFRNLIYIRVLAPQLPEDFPTYILCSNIEKFINLRQWGTQQTFPFVDRFNYAIANNFKFFIVSKDEAAASYSRFWYWLISLMPE